MNAPSQSLALLSSWSVLCKAECVLARRAPSRRVPSTSFSFGRLLSVPAQVLRAASITSRAPAPKRVPEQTLVRVTVPALALAAVWRFLVGAGSVGGIIIAVAHSNAPTPNPSVKRTVTGRPPLASISFWAKTVLPAPAAYLKR